MTTFLVVSWTATLLTALLLAWTVTTSRFLLVKPTMWLLIAHHVVIQWAAAMSTERIYGFLPNPWPFALLVHGFALFGLAGTRLTARATAWEIWQRIPALRTGRSWGPTVAALGMLTVAMILYYFRVVPFEETGLYALLYNPLNAEQARESSLKLVSDPIVRYGYSFVISVFAPLLIGLLVWRVLERRGIARQRALLLALAGLPVLLVAVTLTGARSYAATLLVTMSLVVGFRARFSSRFLTLLPLGLIVPAVPTVLTILREGIAIDLATFLPYLRTFLLERVFLGPMDTGLWYAHYAQTIGFVGVAGVPKLAALLGVSSINMPNTIGLHYTAANIDSVHANTGFVFAYYGYFGIVSFPISLLLLWSIDGVLWILRRLSDTMLAATLAGVAVGAVGFMAAEYTTVLITHGFAVLPIAARLLDREAATQDAPWLAPAPRSAT